MQYQSIIRFFDYSGIEYNSIGEFNVSRAKKLANAEFAMQTDGIIVIDGFSYTKQDILSELEHPGFLARLQFHKIIWEHKGLLSFLEKDALDFHDAGNWYSLSDMPDFVAFISPYFSVVYNRVMRSFLSRNDLVAAANWLTYLYFVEAADEEEALRNTRMYLNDVIRFFRNLNDASYKSRDKELRLWYTTSWSDFINSLPDSLLSYVDEIVSAIINFTVRIQKSGRKICYKISKELLNVRNANYSLIQLIRSNHEAYKQNYKGRTFSGWLRSGANMVYFIIIILFAIARLLSPGSDDTHYDSLNNINIDANTTELLSYKAVRNYYKSLDRELHLFDTAKHKDSKAFGAGEVYLLVEGAKDSAEALTPFTIKNTTQDTIQLRILRSNDVYQFEIGPGQFLSFAPSAGPSVDMLLELGNTPTTNNIPYRADDGMQALHIGASGMENDNNYDYYFADTGSIEMPYLEATELQQKASVVVEIRKRAGAFYFHLKGRGNILYEKGSDANVAIK